MADVIHVYDQAINVATPSIFPYLKTFFFQKYEIPNFVNITIAIGKLPQKWILKEISLNSKGGDPSKPINAPKKPDDPANNPRRKSTVEKFPKVRCARFKTGLLLNKKVFLWITDA
jgi:hypothetical protein